MPNGKNPLLLMMALAMPGAADALGLGDIHVDSQLNERLAAEIGLIGATDDELNGLRAAVANRETFLRYGADRPAFLASATFKVAHDSRGRPVLSIRSTEPFTEPLVNLLVDLRWRKGEIVRQYTLLLDPPGFAAAAAPFAPAAPAAPTLPALPAAVTPILERQLQTVARQVDPPSGRKMTHIKVGARATLRGIAWRVGERTPSDLQRMMIAIFRANPSAFDGNINRLHLGAVLAIPSNADLEAVSPEEAGREFHAQMAAWHLSPRALHASTPAAAGAAPASKTPETEELNKRVQSLEHELAEVQGLLVNQHDKIIDVQQQVALAEKAARDCPNRRRPDRRRPDRRRPNRGCAECCCERRRGALAGRVWPCLSGTHRRRLWATRRSTGRLVFTVSPPYAGARRSAQRRGCTHARRELDPGGRCRSCAGFRAGPGARRCRPRRHASPRA